MVRIVLAGSVSSTFITLQKMLEHQVELVGVLGYEPENTENVSGYLNMKEYCADHGIPYFPFKKIADDSVAETLISLKPDVFFVVGLSQLVPESMLRIATLGNIGFHPTLLPKGRGRAPIAWLILEEKKGAANFFLMGAGADDGPIFIQQPFEVSETDTAQTVEQKIVDAIAIALDQWLPQLKEGKWNPIPQIEYDATWYGKRGPEDGWIDWHQSAMSIHKLIRASAPPHPGAYTFLNHRKLLVMHAALETQIPIKGVIGRVLIVQDEKALIQTGEGLLWVSEVYYEDEKITLKVGQKLGYYAELEIYKLKNEILKIKERLEI